MNRVQPIQLLVSLVMVSMAASGSLRSAEAAEDGQHDLHQTGPSRASSPGVSTQQVLPAVEVRDQKAHETAGQLSITPRQMEQPVHFTDGASLLKEVPNMSVVRKGQQSSDPVFRGLGGSRLSITANDQFLYGGCGIRMDTPTSYINPQAYDEVLIIKGPQTVLKGPGLVAGSVEFVRHPRRHASPGMDVQASISGGSFGYLDGYADLTAGNELLSLRAILNRSRSDDYEDGNGDAVRSWYKRRGVSLNLGLTPSEDVLLELFGESSRSQARFASLHLDAGKIDRDSYGTRMEWQNLSGIVRKFAIEAGRSHQDIIMGRQFRGRQAGGNPDRVTRNARAQLELAFEPDNRTTLGLDWFDDEHRFRPAFRDVARVLNESSDNAGVFIENRTGLQSGRAIVTGYRHDRTRATAHEGGWTEGPTRKTDYALHAAFGRYEHREGNWSHHAGLGYTQRAPDFWERGANRDVAAEKSLQLDIGTAYAGDTWRLSGSAFINRVNDYILIHKDNPALNDLAANSSARNIDAQRYGFELGGEYQWPGHWKAGADLAYTWALNRTDHRPLGQTPPLEARLRFGYNSQTLAVMFNMRAVTRQNRVAIGEGNVNGVDIGRTPGFAVFGLHGSWKPDDALRLSLGVDNLFNRLYAEHLTKAVQTPEFFQGLGVNPNAGSTTRINEPGRTVWLKADISW